MLLYYYIYTHHDHNYAYYLFILHVIVSRYETLEKHKAVHAAVLHDTHRRQWHVRRGCHAKLARLLVRRQSQHRANGRQHNYAVPVDTNNHSRHHVAAIFL